VVGQIIFICFKLLGALALFMFGMQLSSDGIQRAAGDRLQRTVNFMTRNRVVAVFTGMLVTILTQSSSATSVMVVSFVNAGLLSLFQAIGVLMGAHVGTTLTGWVIAAVGIQKFSVAVLAVPLFGVGYFMSIMKKKNEALGNYGESLMGFAMIFLGLEFLASAIPDPSGDALLFLQTFSDKGPMAIAVCVAVGVVFTVLINASSATLAITIGLASKGIIDFQMAAAIVLGANIGTTADAWLVVIGANANAKRAALAHTTLSIVGVTWVLVIFKPFLSFVDFVTPGAISPATVGTHIAMLHTMFNMVNTLAFLPIAGYYARLLSRVFTEKPEAAAKPKAYAPKPLLPMPELNLVQARTDIVQMAVLVKEMYGRFMQQLSEPPKDMAAEVEGYKESEVLADSMLEGLSRFLLGIAEQELNEKTRENIGVMLRVVTDLENITDSILNLGFILERSEKKKTFFDREEIKNLEPYVRLVHEFLSFVQANIDRPLSQDGLDTALRFEEEVDASRAELKRLARRRLKAGADVKAELLFIDLIRHVEKIGDFAYAISESLRELR
jgi:phosphate:Na+ symporter